MEQIKLHIQLFNTVYKCAFCDQWQNALQSQCHVLSKIEGVRPGGANEATLTLSSALVCETCFQNEKEDMELKDDPPVKGPEIVLPK